MAEIDERSGSERVRFATIVFVVSLMTVGCGSLGFASKRPAQKNQQHALERREAASRAAGEEPRHHTAESAIAAGDRYRESGKSDQAMLRYLESVRLDPESSLPRERIGFMQLGHDLERAESIFSELVEKNPRDASALRGLGLAYLGLGKYADAQQALERSLAIEPNSASAHYALGATLGLEGQHEAALVHTQQARELDPHEATIANGLGVAHMMLRHYREAEAEFRAAIVIDSQVAAYYNNLGLSLAGQDRYEEALAAFRRHGNEQAAQNNLGYAYYLNHRYEDAIEHYELALLENGDEKALVLQNLTDALDALETSGSVPASKSAQ